MAFGSLRRLLPLLPLLLLFALPRAASAQATGILEVKCNVDGALVLLDGEPLGETPLLEIIPAGRHTVTITKAGFKDWSDAFQLAPDNTAEIVAQLQRIKPALEVRSDTEEAVVELDGKEVGRGALVVIDPVEPGAHQLRVSAEGYGEWESRITLREGTVTPVTVQLRGTLGSIVVTTEPQGAKVFVDGVERGTTPATIDPVKPGPHGLRITKDGHSDVLRAVVVDPGKAVSVEAALVTEGGSLEIKPNLGGARVFVNGVDLGTGKQTLGPLKPGMYSVRVTAPDHTDFIKTVQVEADKKTSLAAKLEAFDFGGGLARTPSSGRPVHQQPGFWAALGGGVGAGIAVAVIAGVAASNAEQPDPGPTVTPPATTHAFTLP